MVAIYSYSFNKTLASTKTWRWLFGILLVALVYELLSAFTSLVDYLPSYLQSGFIDEPKSSTLTNVIYYLYQLPGYYMLFKLGYPYKFR